MTQSHSRLRAEAAPFHPQSYIHSVGLFFDRQDLSTHYFRPRSGLNVFAEPFVPAFHASKPLTNPQTTTKSSSAFNVNAHVFVPSSGLTAVDWSLIAATAASKKRDFKETTTSQDNLPQSTTREFVETGRLVPRLTSTTLVRRPSEYPTPNGLEPSFVPAGEVYYNGSTERQRRQFKLQQKAEREIQANWKGRLLFANGDEMPNRRDMWTAEMQEAELEAQPFATHHFNWLGQPVDSKTHTPPAVSMVVIMSLIRPRGITFGRYQKNLYRSVLFNNGLATIDPVYYYGDRADTVVNLKGTALQEAVIGDVVRMYSTHGWWHDEILESYEEDEDKPEVDPLDETDYDPMDIILNGWFENHDLPTARDFVELDSNANETDALLKQLKVLRALHSAPQKSRLNEIQSRYELEIADILDQHPQSTSKLVVSKPSHEELRTCTRQLSEYDQKLENWADESDELSRSDMNDGEMSRGKSQDSSNSSDLDDTWSAPGAASDTDLTLDTTDGSIPEHTTATAATVGCDGPLYGEDKDLIAVGSHDVLIGTFDDKMNSNIGIGLSGQPNNLPQYSDMPSEAPTRSTDSNVQTCLSASSNSSILYESDSQAPRPPTRLSIRGRGQDVLLGLHDDASESDGSSVDSEPSTESSYEPNLLVGTQHTHIQGLEFALEGGPSIPQRSELRSRPVMLEDDIDAQTRSRFSESDDDSDNWELDENLPLTRQLLPDDLDSMDLLSENEDATLQHEGRDAVYSLQTRPTQACSPPPPTSFETAASIFGGGRAATDQTKSILKAGIGKRNPRRVSFADPVSSDFECENTGFEQSHEDCNQPLSPEHSWNDQTLVPVPELPRFTSVGPRPRGNFISRHFSNRFRSVFGGRSVTPKPQTEGGKRKLFANRLNITLKSTFRKEMNVLN